MNVLNVLREFRRLVQARTWDVPVPVDYENDRCPTLEQTLAPFPELEKAAKGNKALEFEALDLLEECVPRPWTFAQFHNGAEWLEVNDKLEIIYRYDRTKTEIIAVIGKACMRAAKVERAA